ncbi:hypothetical protein PIB30_031408 [Stylosanthes scabra]|uniref:FAS1 domain-containing protein n=1 Tax=Stylosanthes scabra TaxID=79078 RepID=A0ABU6Z8Q7_9FABA|nr:hypothetical protein [Stylosanthes scabra]
MKRRVFLKHSIALILMMVTMCCLLVVIVTVLKLPDASTKNSEMVLYPKIRSRKIPHDFKLSKLGDMMLEMLPHDLAFTVFVPSEEAFKRDLRLDSNDGLKPDKYNDTYAIVSRVLGFSAVPRSINSDSVKLGELVNYESLSGFSLYISKDIDGMLVVNRVRSEMVDFKRNEIVVHVMDGVIMDAEFEQSVLSDETEED